MDLENTATINGQLVKLPTHVAIIVDGNGRWAKERGLTRMQGHDAGFKNLKKLANHIFDRGIKVASFYVFSTENFKRSAEEVGHLMDIFVILCRRELKTFMKNNIKVVFSGGDAPLPQKVIEARDWIAEQTKDNTGGIINFCLNYGGRAEIVHAVKRIAAEKSADEIANLTEQDFAKYLYQDLPDVDLMIRTSGELRLSNFLLWQNSYAEFYFPKTKFPDFSADDFDQALIEYTLRDRRFGGIKNA